MSIELVQLEPDTVVRQKIAGTGSATLINDLLDDACGGARDIFILNRYHLLNGTDAGLRFRNTARRCGVHHAGLPDPLAHAAHRASLESALYFGKRSNHPGSRRFDEFLLEIICLRIGLTNQNLAPKTDVIGTRSPTRLARSLTVGVEDPRYLVGRLIGSANLVASTGSGNRTAGAKYRHPFSTARLGPQFGEDWDFVHVPEPAMVTDDRVDECPIKVVEHLLVHRPDITRGNADKGEFWRHTGRHANLEAAVGDVVEHSDLLDQPPGLMKSQDISHYAQSDFLAHF